jgi:hypothetical protein
MKIGKKDEKTGRTNMKTSASGNSGEGFAARGALCNAAQEMRRPPDGISCDDAKPSVRSRILEKILMR